MRIPAMKTLLAALALLAAAAAGCGSGEKDPGKPLEGLPEYLPRSMDFHIFYYPWYGTPEFDGAYRHWNHAVLAPDGSETGFTYPGGDDIGSNFYPRAGCYSSNDPETVARHCFEIRLAGAGVICVSWWGPGSFEDKAVRGILDQAYRHGLKVDFHIEPFEGRTAAAVRDAIVYILDNYGEHPAFYRTDRFGVRPLFFVYDSYLISAGDWSTVLSPGGANTIRGTKYDSSVIGLVVGEDDLDSLLAGGFDGCYTYFAAEGFTWGSTTTSWPAIFPLAI